MQALKGQFAIFCILLAGCNVAEIRIEPPRTGVAAPVTNVPPATQPALSAPTAPATLSATPLPEVGAPLPAETAAPIAEPTLVAPLPSPATTTTRSPDQPTAQPSGPFWDTSPTARIIRLYGGWSMAGACNPTNYYILQAQVWGDGRIIWVQSDGIARRVFEGKLTTDQMKSLLRHIVEAGFFGWEDKYNALGGNSYSPRYLSVNLIGQSKEISEHGAAPDAFYELRDFISNGVGVAGHEFAPVRGYLTATSFPWATEEEQERLPLWPDHAAGFTLDQVGNGRYVEGEALAAVWQAVNQNPRACVLVKSNGQVYAVAVQIPEVSFSEPPAP